MKNYLIWVVIFGVLALATHFLFPSENKIVWLWVIAGIIVFIVWVVSTIQLPRDPQ